MLYSVRIRNELTALVRDRRPPSHREETADAAPDEEGTLQHSHVIFVLNFPVFTTGPQRHLFRFRITYKVDYFFLRLASESREKCIKTHQKRSFITQTPILPFYGLKVTYMLGHNISYRCVKYA